jgi:hypothetical protein
MKGINHDKYWVVPNPTTQLTFWPFWETPTFHIVSKLIWGPGELVELTPKPKDAKVEWYRGPHPDLSDYLPPLPSDKVAPRGHFRVLGVDAFVGPFAHFHVGDFHSSIEAFAIAAERAGRMKPMYI